MIKSIIGIYVNNKNKNFNNLRYNYSNFLFGSLLILIEGRNKFYKDNLDIEVFDFNNGNFFKYLKELVYIDKILLLLIIIFLFILDLLFKIILFLL